MNIAGAKETGFPFVLFSNFRKRKQDAKMAFWQSVRTDLENRIAEGMEIVVEKATFVKEKAEELTGEKKERSRLLELRTRAGKEMTELGGHVYELKRSEVGSPPGEDTVRSIIEKCKKLKDQISKLEVRAKEVAARIPRNGIG